LFNLLFQIVSLIHYASRERSSEINIFEGILKWVEHDEETRKDGLFDLIKPLNLERIFTTDPDLVKEKFRDGSLLDKDAECSKLFNEICQKMAAECVRLKRNELDQTLALPLPPTPKPASNRLVLRLPKSISIKITPVNTFEPELESANKNDRQLRKRVVCSTSDNNEPAAAGVEIESDNVSSGTSDVQLLTKKPRNSAGRAIVSFADHFQNYPTGAENEMKILNVRKLGSTSYFDVYNFHVRYTRFKCSFIEVTY